MRVLARRYGINQKTVVKWKRRTSTAVPYKVHMVLTDNGIHFTTQAQADRPCH